MEKIVARFLYRVNKCSDFFVCDANASTKELEQINTPAQVLARGKKRDGTCNIRVVGMYLPTIKNIDIEFFGDWETSKFGITQFKATSFLLVPPTEEAAIADYLLYTVRGLGSTMAKTIASRFGSEAVAVVEEQPERLVELRGISLAKALRLQSDYMGSKSLYDLVAFLGKYGLSGEKAGRVFRKLSTDSLNAVKANPYVMQEAGIGFADCDSVARQMGILQDSNQRILGAAEQVLTNAKNFGHCCLPYGEFAKQVIDMLNDSTPEPVELPRFEEAYVASLKQKRLFQRAGDFVFSYGTETAESDFAGKISRMLVTPISDEDKESAEEAFSAYLSEHPTVSLADTQKEGVLNALYNRVSVLTGGPGTGKTFTVDVVRSSYKRAFPNRPVTLIAPTGKAARRMTESTGEPATTVHRAIGLYTGTEEEESSIVLPEGLIIIDESSMLDAFVAGKLAHSLPVNSQVVFVGDVDQLPSVGPGTVLKDMIESGVVPTTKLQVIFRQTGESPIIGNAKKINEGKTELVYDKDKFRFIEAKTDNEILKNCMEEYLKEVATYSVQDVALLMPIKQEHQMVGVINANRMAQGVVNPITPGEISVQIGDYTFHKGDRVMQTKNNPPYAANGELGELASISVESKDGRETMLFEIEWENGNKCSYTRTDMNNVELGYALTIHKSQGSEYKSVIIPTVSHQAFCLNRNLIYTGITRSKDRVLIVGQKEALKKAILSVDSTKRFTLLSSRMKHYVDLRSSSVK